MQRCDIESLKRLWKGFLTLLPVLVFLGIPLCLIWYYNIRNWIDAEAESANEARNTAEAPKHGPEFSKLVATALHPRGSVAIGSLVYPSHSLLVYESTNVNRYVDWFHACSYHCACPS